MNTVILKNGAEIKTVAERSRLSFLPRYFGNFYMKAENSLYNVADKMLAGYHGGYWTFAVITTQDGGKYPLFLLKNEEKTTLENPFSNEKVLIDDLLAGLILTIYVCNLLETERAYIIAEGLTRIAYDYAQESGQMNEAYALLD